jgi:superfamily II DNA or RNA helicase
VSHLQGALYSPIQLVQLDPHQEAAVVEGIRAMRGIVKYPTGVGKGRILGETVRRLNLKTLVLVDKKDLLHQLAQEVSMATDHAAGLNGDGRG